MTQQGIGLTGGVPLESNGGVPVNIQDQTSDIIDLHLTRFIDDVTIVSGVSIDDGSISLSCATLPVSGNTICLKESYAFYQAEIITVTPDGGDNYTLLMTMPADYAYTTSCIGTLRDKNMSLVVGSALNPVSYSLSPTNLVDPMDGQSPQLWDIVRFMISIKSEDPMDDGRFGGIAPLTNGIVIRKRNGTYKNIFNARDNGDFALHTFDTTYVPATLGPSGLYGMRIRRTFAGQEKNGVTIRIGQEAGDAFEILVRDDLTGLTEFTAVAQGHIVTG